MTDPLTFKSTSFDLAAPLQLNLHLAGQLLHLDAGVPDHVMAVGADGQLPQFLHLQHALRQLLSERCHLLLG